MRFRVFLVLAVLLSMLPLPSSAAYEWNNEITVNTDGMVWEYTEKYSGERSVVFKTFIDKEFGDNDGFVSAWEFLKADVKTSDSFFNSVEKNMDVRIDNSSADIVLLSVESSLSHELIGLTTEERDIVNNYQVFYEFKTPLSDSGSNMWFQAEPETPVTINLGPDISLLSVEGVDDQQTKEDATGTHIHGDVGFNSEIRISFSVKEPVQKDENTTGPIQPEETEKSGSSFFENLFPELSAKLFG